MNTTNIRISSGVNLSAAAGPVEIVERKGLGHPDTICDALAEAVSLALSRYYIERFGYILHHNVDKALLWGGVSRPVFRGGEILQPIEIFLAGRATSDVQGVVIPVNDIVVDTCKQWLKSNLSTLDAERHVKLHTLIRPGSADLVEVFRQQRATGIALANDTSCGVGYAPFDRLETLVYQTEQYLNSPEVKTRFPELGADIKVMGVRQDRAIALTVACAFVDRYVDSALDYMDKKRQLQALVRDHCATLGSGDVSVQINAADLPQRGALYLTVTGTSAECGDDGEVGRGNRVNGLITPYRPMNMEAAAGKNPVTHVGKLYNIAAQKICTHIVNSIASVAEARCYLVSRIGHPIQEPQACDVHLSLKSGALLNDVEREVERMVGDQLQQLADIQKELLQGAIKVY